MLVRCAACADATCCRYPVHAWCTAFCCRRTLRIPQFVVVTAASAAISIPQFVVDARVLCAPVTAFCCRYPPREAFWYRNLLSMSGSRAGFIPHFVVVIGVATPARTAICCRCERKLACRSYRNLLSLLVNGSICQRLTA